MTDLTTLKALRERVRGATGPDRELDAEIDVALFGGETVWKDANYTTEAYPASRRPSRNHVGGFAHERVPLVTASLDAAVALVERLLPGSAWCIERHHTGVFHVVLWSGDNGRSCNHFAAPLAVLNALLFALISQAEKKEGADV